MSFVIGLRNSGMSALPRDSNQYRLPPSPDEACRCEPNCRYRSWLLGPIPFIPHRAPQSFAEAGQIHTTGDVVLYPALLQTACCLQQCRCDDVWDRTRTYSTLHAGAPPKLPLATATSVICLPSGGLARRVGSIVFLDRA